MRRRLLLRAVKLLKKWRVTKEEQVTMEKKRLCTTRRRFEEFVWTRSFYSHSCPGRCQQTNWLLGLARPQPLHDGYQLSRSIGRRAKWEG
jgi:hypothetical protein